MSTKSSNKPRRRLLNLAVLMALGGGALAPASASAANLYWVCGSNTWGVSISCWSTTPGGAATPYLQPASGDSVFLTQTDATNRSVTYQIYSSPANLNSLSIDSTGTGTMTLSQTYLGTLLTTATETIGINGTGTHTHSTGTNTVSGNLYLGYNSGGNGTYNLGGISLTSGMLSGNFEYVGYSGTGVFNQTRGTNTVSTALYIGTNSGSDGTYNLSAGTLSAASEYIGTFSSSTGAFNQSGGTNTVSADLFLGYLGGSSGTYTLSGTGNLSASSEFIGRSGSGDFTQIGGTNTISSNLYLGYNSGSSGTYNLNVGSLSVFRETIGYSGTGAFNQLGGTHTVSDVLYLGYIPGGNGTYNLSGGTLNVGHIAGGGGVSTFNLDGGTLNLTGSSISLYAFNIGNASGSNGSFTLGNGQTLTTGNETIGNSGIGAFTQSGGTNTMSTSLVLGYGSTGNGSYTLNSGNLSAGGEFIGRAGTGTFTQSGGTNTTGALYLGLYSGGIGSYNLGAGSLSAGSETIGNSGSGTFTQSGGTNTVTNTLTLGTNSGSSGTYNLNGGTFNVGSIANGAGVSTFNLDGGTLNFTGTSISLDNFNIGNASGSNGSFTLNTGKTLTASNETIGYMGVGTFTQSGGTHTVATSLTMGKNAGSGGTYTLNGGTLNVNSIANGAGISTFNLDGGTLSLTGSSISLDRSYIGRASGSNGSFTLGAGQTFAASFEYIGHSGTGAFTQNDGTNTVDGSLYLGYNSGSSGSYNLNAGNLSASGSEMIGVYGTGAFTQSGGTNTADILELGFNSGSNVTYNLSAGNLNAAYETIGAMGNGTFNQSGGTNTVSNTIFELGRDSGGNGTYDLSGGSLSARYEVIGSSGTGAFNQTGGTHTVTGTMTLAAISGSTGTYNLTGGALTVNGGIANNAGGSFFAGAGTTTTVGGTGFVNHGLLGGGGTIAGNVTSDGAVGPGSSPGTFSITGDYTQLALGSLSVEIGGMVAGSQYDVLNVSGTATLDGLLNVVLFDMGSGLFAPHAGDTFDILTASIITGSFSSLSFATLSNPNLFWQIDTLTDYIGTTDVVRLSIGQYATPPAPVPEPETYAMLLAGLGLLGFVGRRRRNAAA
ncbi:MAG: PEP-CTERM sorting domain-containing protein [Nitrosomonadales bacterium]|nr:PEP-CTERM sorting domain-containing protein [Nitrosomonadales bacterium]